MKVETFYSLKKLQEKYGIKGKPSGPFGKIIQKLLALSLFELGATNIVERSVQGADIDITLNGKKYTLEVKTTETLYITLSHENVQALLYRSYDGYQPIIAVLRLTVFTDWILALIPKDEIPTGQILIDNLNRYRMKDLEKQLSPIFDKVVIKHFKDIFKGGEQYLKEQLRQAGIAQPDS
jgi:Holliday junction resolvase